MNNILIYKYRLKSISFILFLLLGVTVFTSCSGDDDPNNDPGNGKLPQDVATFSMYFNTRATEDIYMNNAKLFVFDDKSTPLYMKQQLTTRDGDILKATMDIGTYNLVLLSAGSAYTYIAPNYQGPIDNSVMFKLGTLSSHNDTLLTEAPELRYDILNNVPIVNGQTTQRNSTLNRSVVKIRVILDAENSPGINPALGIDFDKAFVSLYNIPTTLNWNGNFALDAANKPIIDTRPLRKAFNFTELVPSIKVDTIDFVLPAHRGNEFNTDGTPNTTATPFSHKFKVRIGLPVGNTVMIKEAEVSDDKLLRPNHTVHLKVKFIGEPDGLLNISPYVMPWEDYIDQENVIE